MQRKNQFPRAVSGLTLIEVIVALAIIAVGLAGIMSALTSIATLADANHDQLLAINIARQKLAEIQTTPFSTIFSQYGPGTSNSTFSVSQLQNGTGSIIFPVNTSHNLDETVIDANLGMPQDLSGNGSATNTNVSGTYTVLPLRIHIQWSSVTGTRQMDVNILLTKLK